jgi:phage terminase small subunit
MPHVKLTAKQEAFCQGIADGLGQADSYRAAYDAEGMKDNTIYPLASKLMKNDKVAARISELRESVQEKQLWSREMSVKALVQAYREGSGATKVSAVKELNAMHGYNEPSKLQVNGTLIQRIQREIYDGKDAQD